jgi:hypothetical protein
VIREKERNIRKGRGRKEEKEERGGGAEEGRKTYEDSWLFLVYVYKFHLQIEKQKNYLQNKRLK